MNYQNINQMKLFLVFLAPSVPCYEGQYIMRF